MQLRLVKKRSLLMRLALRVADSSWFRAYAFWSGAVFAAWCASAVVLLSPNEFGWVAVLLVLYATLMGAFSGNEYFNWRGGK